ncbi:hypothetical protein HDV02_004987 [Globomyces sp. JEL0801]|nr:hypothetical protein HDV02_004987 [Globomyces sp. JEL0801]
MTELCFYDMGRNGTNLLLKSPTTLFKIINSSENQKIEWYMQARMYDVYERKVVTPYEFSLHHSFSNARARRERFQTGKVHVAVGFVDLSLLLEMDLAINDAKWGPFQFIGYEASAFSVAKTMVIASMLKRSDKMIFDAILQVWYSSCWSTDTLKAFREAVSEAKLGCIDDNVLALLNHWAKSNPQSANYAQNRWLQKIDTSNFTSVVNALKLESRNTLSQYFLSGQLLPGTVASIAMFEAPTSLRSSRSRNESVFHSLDYSQLIDATKKSNNNFVSGAISILRSKIARLNKLIVSGKVNVVVKPPAIISPAFPKVIKEISSLNPYSISWNNCLDYLPREKFHTLARACSAAEDTIHFGYSMNWPGDVKGGSCLSFPVGEHFHEIMKTSRLGISLMYTMLGVNGLLRDPPIDNPINIFDISARTQCYKYWTKHFFENVPNIGQIEPSIYSVFSRSNSSLFLTWSSSMEFLNKSMYFANVTITCTF